MPADGCDLDHVAVAVHDLHALWRRFAGDLGGVWVAGGPAVGFVSEQVRFANGMKVEGLRPHLTERNDFLQRFLDRSGPGPHHLTYKVADIGEAMERAAAAGYEPVSVDVTDPGWKEAFLHPKSSHGIVIQLAQSEGEWSSPPPDDLPAAAVARPAALLHVAHAVADLEAALGLFKGVLGGATIDAGAGGGLGWVDLAWPGPGRVRLLSGSPLDPWLDGRPGRLHHLAFAVAEPGEVPGAVGSDGCYVAAPTPETGVRLVLVAEGDEAPPLPAGAV